MRQAQVATTMNVYGNALMTTKREANSKQNDEQDWKAVGSGSRSLEAASLRPFIRPTSAIVESHRSPILTAPGVSREA